jgi:hypothetical protein
MKLGGMRIVVTGRKEWMSVNATDEKLAVIASNLAAQGTECVMSVICWIRV